MESSVGEMYQTVFQKVVQLSHMPLDRTRDAVSHCISVLMSMRGARGTLAGEDGDQR